MWLTYMLKNSLNLEETIYERRYVIKLLFNFVWLLGRITCQL